MFLVLFDHSSTGIGLFFNLTRFNFKSIAANISDTPLLSTVLYIDQDLVEEEPSFEISLYGPHFDNFHFFFFFPRAFNSARLRLNINNSSLPGQFSQIHHRFNVTDDFMRCTFKTKTFFVVPVQVYAVLFSGKFRFSLLSRQANKLQFTHLFGFGEIDSGMYICTGIVYAH